MRGHSITAMDKVLLRMFPEGPEGFKSGLSEGNHHHGSITQPHESSISSKARDLAEPVEKRKALIRT